MGWTSDQYVLKVNFYSVPKTNIMCYFKEHIVFLFIWPCADLWVHWSAAVLCTQLSVNIAINIDVLLQMGWEEGMFVHPQQKMKGRRRATHSDLYSLVNYIHPLHNILITRNQGHGKEEKCADLDLARYSVASPYKLRWGDRKCPKLNWAALLGWTEVGKGPSLSLTVKLTLRGRWTGVNAA